MRLWKALTALGVVAMALAALGTAAAASLGSVSFTANLSGANEVPPVNTALSATGPLTFDPGTKTLTYDLTVGGVSVTSAADIHLGAAGVSGPLLHSLDTNGMQTVAGSVALSDSDVEDLYSGNLYVEVHSALPGGVEASARAQLDLPGTEPMSMASITTNAYRFDLAVNPAETMLMPDMAGTATTGELMVAMPGMPMPPMSMTDQGMPINHHVEVHIFDKATGAVVKMAPMITLTNEATGATRTLGMGNIMAMYGLDVGQSDFHFGNNMYLPDGTYQVTATLNGETAMFQHVMIKAASSLNDGHDSPPSRLRTPVTPAWPQPTRARPRSSS